MRNAGNETPSYRTMRLIPTSQKSNDNKTDSDTGNVGNPLRVHYYGNMSIFIEVPEITCQNGKTNTTEN